MPAHPDRQQILVRLYPDQMRKLDAVVAARKGVRSRSQYLLDLVMAEFDKLPERRKRAVEKEIKAAAG